uniref:Bm542 n=1 Tax=Brugia malayi TaxID=6279 RepID=A0A0I9N5W0_BRUMA|nr:Bm542 [Brugia malayi]
MWNRAGRLVLMSFQQSGLKENIQLSKETTELIESLAVFLRVPLTPSQLLVCVELLQKGVSYRSLIDAIIRYSGKNISGQIC